MSRRISPPHIVLHCVAAAAMLGGLSATAHAAGLMGDSVNVSLISPGDGINATDSGLTVVAGEEVSPLIDPSNIGGSSGYMLTGVAGIHEYIDLDALTITLRLLNGNADGTGFAAGAKYVFGDLDIAGFTITGVTGVSSGISNFSSSWISLDDPHQISFAIDAIEFGPVTGGTRYGDVVLTLATRADGGGGNPAPEPGTLALAGIAIGGLWAGRRRARRG